MNENGLDYVRSSMVFNMKMAYQNFSALCFFFFFLFLHDISLGYATITLLKLLVICHFTQYSSLMSFCGFECFAHRYLLWSSLVMIGLNGQAKRV